MKKRVLVLTLTLVMVLTLLPFGAMAASAGGLEYTVKNGAAIVTGYTTEPKGVLVIPETLGGKPVREISDGAFWQCQDLTEVQFPSGLKAIRSDAFGNCSSLAKISFPDGLETVETGAFVGTALTDVDIPDSVIYLFQGFDWDNFSTEWVDDVQYYGDIAFRSRNQRSSYTIRPGTRMVVNTFRENKNLTSVTLPESVTVIGEDTFYLCKNLEQIQLPESLLYVLDGAFMSSGLKSIRIPAHVKLIGDRSFTTIRYDAGDKKLESVVFEGNELETIGESAFAYSGVWNQTLAIPDSVRSIGKEAFRNFNAANLVLGSGLKEVPQYCFADDHVLESVTIPTSIQTIRAHAFCNSLSYDTAICYTGSESEWNHVTIEKNNDPLKALKVYFNGETGPGGRLLNITTQPKSVSAAAGETVTMKVVATGENLTYQWRYRKADGSWANTTLSGNKTDTLSIPATLARSGNVYNCLIKSEYDTIISDPATLAVMGIKTHPKDVTAAAGKTVTMKVVAQGENLTYQWQYQKADGTWAKTTLSGNQTNTLSIPATYARSGNVYRCVVKSGSNSVNSNPAKLTVFGIKTQPKNVSAPIGKTVTMKVAATGTGLTYQWQYKATDGTWKNTTLEGAKTATLKIPVTAARNGNVYRCVVKCGSSTINSNAAKVTVFSIKTQPSNVTAAVGKTVTMKVVASGTGLTYQWQYKASDGTWKNTTLTGNQTATLSIPATAARNGNIYRCVVKCGTSTITSNAAKLTVK